ncbi:hypothetical protein HX900_13910 [Rhizobium sp. WYCCWR 11290]|uniref:Uncharacterized protein n=1 Tax=Rhizobium changzhiense TaxID=2692317 RepID=A0A7Z0RLA7_9HYPH|nr:hypothetical protein [Rhizobium changzhiense]NZD62200.1 hypothetical protein [Rhizobium changzhiense]
MLETLHHLSACHATAVIFSHAPFDEISQRRTGRARTTANTGPYNECDIPPKIRAAPASCNAAFFVAWPSYSKPIFNIEFQLLSAYQLAARGRPGGLTGQIVADVAYLLFPAAFFHASVAFRTSARRIPRNECVIAPRAWISL